jgi:PAS domain-containing protein
MAVALVCALGPVLRIAGVAVAPLPWLPLAYIPPFENILPVRLVAYAALAAGLCVASYLARRASPARVALALAALAAPLAALAADIWRAPAPIPHAVRGAAVSRVLHPGEVALVLPFGGLGHGMLWQAEAGFRFRQAGGYLRPDPPGPFAHDPAVEALRAGTTPSEADFRAFLRRSGARVRHITDFFVEAREEQLLEQEASYRRATDHAPACILSADAAEGRIFDANGVAERLLGFPRATLVGRRLEDLLPPAERSRVPLLQRS